MFATTRQLMQQLKLQLGIKGGDPLSPDLQQALSEAWSAAQCVQGWGVLFEWGQQQIRVCNEMLFVCATGAAADRLNSDHISAPSGTLLHHLRHQSSKVGSCDF